jgi:hypothetical protein
MTGRLLRNVAKYEEVGNLAPPDSLVTYLLPKAQPGTVPTTSLCYLTISFLPNCLLVRQTIVRNVFVTLTRTDSEIVLGSDASSAQLSMGFVFDLQGEQLPRSISRILQTPA